MTIPRDTMSVDNFNRWDRGLPLRDERDRTPKPDPELPVVKDALKEIPNLEIRDVGVRRRNVQNADGVRFMGYDVYLQFEDGETLDGWLPENEFEQLKRRIPAERTDLLKKMAL